jgi:hypothetical protein
MPRKTNAIVAMWSLPKATTSRNVRVKCLALPFRIRGTRVHTQCVQDSLGLFFPPLQCHLFASCGIKSLEVSAVADYSFKAEETLHHVFCP